MELNELKKEIYKQQPTAKFVQIIKGVAVYSTDALRPYPGTIYFNIPISDMGDAVFKQYMDAKLLIRWVQNKDDEH